MASESGESVPSDALSRSGFFADSPVDQSFASVASASSTPAGSRSSLAAGAAGPDVDEVRAAQASQVAQALRSEVLAAQLSGVLGRQWRGVVVFFWVGVVVFLVGAGSAVVASSGDGRGTVWTGGMFAGVLLLMRSCGAYGSYRRNGGDRLGNDAWVLTAGVLVVVFVGGLLAAMALLG
ncbi:hypothetical protein JCM9957A_02220 [Kineosporia succinea]